MELKITEEKENKLFNRKEIKGIIESDATPSRPEVANLLSEKFSVPSGNIKIKHIKGKFGSKTLDIEANIYSSQEEKDSIELKKKKDAAEKPAAEKKPAEESPPQPEEAKEEIKEQKPEENKPEQQ